jgi:hypothetical protein
MTMPEDPVACVALKCMAIDVHPVEWCERVKHCPYAYQRRRDQDRAEREAKDRRRQPQAPVAPEGR